VNVESARILVVDDDAGARMLMHAALRKSGFDVSLASGGADGLDQFRNGAFDMVMLDVDMPDIDGYAVCSTLRAEVGQLLPIVMVTGMDDVLSVERAYDNGATDFIAKPINWAIIGHRVKYLLRGHMALLELQFAHAQTAAILAAIPDLLFEMDIGGRFIDYRAPHSDRLAAHPENFIGHLVADVFPPDAANVFMAALQAAHESGSSSGRQYRLKLPGGVFWFELAVSRMEVAAGQTPRFIALSRDITERKHAEDALVQSLEEKQGLLQEVHHRVKNNLQVIASLLRLESRRSAVEDTKTVLRDMQGRIHSMALLHKSLYRSGTFASVDLGSYLRQLSTQAFQAQATHSGAVQLVLNLGSVQVSMDQAIPCGLIVNELISNCLKHGFPIGVTGNVHIELQPLGAAQRWCLCVADNGVGLPENFEDKRKASLGLQLVADLAHQLGGELKITPNRDRGVAFTVNFPVTAPAVLAIPA
jgi:PAS domain S-box-containing protein